MDDLFQTGIKESKKKKKRQDTKMGVLLKLLKEDPAFRHQY